MTVLLVALGAAVGAPLRYLTDQALRARYGTGFPWGTLTVNVGGSLLLGFLVGLPVSPALEALLGTGFCGALTTYSTFSWETLTLARAGCHGRAIANILLNVGVAVAAAYLGLSLALALR